MSKTPFKELEKLAIRAALDAGAVLLKHFSRKIQVSEKKNAGLVTNADVEAERATLKVLKRGPRSMGFLTEESALTGSAELRSNQGIEGRWIIDPLDGTTNFVHRFPMFCVSIAAEWQGELAVGVIYHPILKDLYIGIQGKGAKLGGKRIRVSQTRSLRDSLLTTGFSYRKDEWLHREMEAFERLSGIARAIRRPGSAALDLAYVARGVFDGFWERRLSPWDIAAGALIVKEAGGRVTNLKREEFTSSMNEIIASNALLHEDLANSVAPEFCPVEL